MKKSILFLIVCFLFSFKSYAGGGWVYVKGKGYFKVSEWWIVSDQHFTDSGLIDPNITSGIFNTSLYGEYGITDRLTGILYFPFFSRATMNNVVSQTTGEIITPGDAINSIGDTDLGIKYGITKPGSKVAVAATLTLGLPLGNSAGGEQKNLQTGDGEFNQILQLDAGTGFQLKKIGAYANAFVGVNNRTKGFSDEFRYGFEVGASFFNSKWWIIGRITGVESFQNGTIASEINSTSIFANNSEYTSYGLETAFYVTKQFGVSAGYASAFRGQIIFARPSYSVGVFLDLSK